MNNELLRCPFCGTMPIEDGKDCYLNIRCEGCGIESRSFYFDADDDASIEQASNAAADAWNKRPQPAQAVQDDARDAARYRWLRHADNDELVIQHGPIAPDYHWLPRNGRLDAMIDAAMAGKGK